jgi:acid phosphatase family membrane protein YuiD
MVMKADVFHFVQGLWQNGPLLAALVAIGFTQLLKVPVHLVLHRRLDWHKVIDAGGMPSSHAAGAAALTTALAYVVGPQSPIFATAVVFSAIVMYDAGGIRRHAGEHAVLLNRIAEEISKVGITVEASATDEQGERVKEILGHEPQEVVVGALIGALIGALFGKYW